MVRIILLHSCPTKTAFMSLFFSLETGVSVAIYDHVWLEECA